MPMTPPSVSSLKNSKTGAATEKWPASTTSTRVRTSTVPVTSLKADSEITVWETLGRRPSLSKRGMRMAGSVGASTAPIMNATSRLTPKIGAITTPTMSALMKTPGKTSRARPTAVREITRSEIPTPPWKRIRATPMLNSSCAPTPPNGFSTMPSTEGPMSAPAATSRIISGIRKKVARNCATRPAPSMSPKSLRMCSTSTA